MKIDHNPNITVHQTGISITPQISVENLHQVNLLNNVCINVSFVESLVHQPNERGNHSMIVYYINIKNTNNVLIKVGQPYEYRAAGRINFQKHKVQIYLPDQFRCWFPSQQYDTIDDSQVIWWFDFVRNSNNKRLKKSDIDDLLLRGIILL